MTAKKSMLNPVQLGNVTYQHLLAQAGAREAVDRVEIAQRKCDSVSRKLQSGSEAVSIDLLAHWERTLVGAKVKLAEKMPSSQEYPM